MSDGIVFSCVIPASAKDFESQKLQDLISSIKAQDFPQDKIEILVITEGDSESAKAIGIRRARGEICAMFCADNSIESPYLFRQVLESVINSSAVFTARYSYKKDDNSLNRYFSLIGGNDPICYYLGKNDREPHVKELTVTSNYPPSYGCNGFFYESSKIKATDLDNYYPMDNAMEVKGNFTALDNDWIWHRTSDDLITFLTKRYKYAKDLYCDRGNRRWRMLDTREDYWRLLYFIGATLTLIQPLSVSIRGFSKVRDWAWFWHWPVCFGFLITYGALTFRTFFVRLLSRHLGALNPLIPASRV